MRWIYGIGLGGFGLLLVVGGIFGYVRRVGLRRHGVRARGTVVDIRRAAGRDANDYPVIEFRAADGRTLRFESSVPAPENLEKGSGIDVIYLPGKPDVADQAGAEQSGSGNIAAAVLGLFFLAGAGLAWNSERLAARLFRRGPVEVERPDR